MISEKFLNFAPRANKIRRLKVKLMVSAQNAAFSPIISIKEEIGYDRKYTIIRQYVATKKTELNNKATVRFETMPGVQAQADWAFFENYRVLEVVEVLDHILSNEALAKKKRAVDNQITMSGFPFKKTMGMFNFSFQPSIDKTQIDELCIMHFVENRGL